jgi:hypothetical protein
MFAGREVGKSALAGEDREGLEVVRVRKEVEELELREMQALGREPAHVPEERRRIAGKVSYRSNGALPESLDESGRESPPRRIEDDPIGGGEPRASGVGRSIASQEADASGEALCDGALGVLARVVEGEPMGPTPMTLASFRARGRAKRPTPENRSSPRSASAVADSATTLDTSSSSRKRFD